MTSRLLAALAILVTAGTAFAQPASGGATNPTRVETETTGPQDSVGSAGESPTKSMIIKSGKKDAKDRDGSGTGKEKGKAAPAQGEKKNAPRDGRTDTGN